MAIKFTIGKKIGAGFAVLIILTTLAFILTVVTLKDSKSKTDTVVGQLAPSVAELKELNLLIQRSGTDVTQWMFNSSSSDISFREDLDNIITTEYPEQRKELENLSKDWSDSTKQDLKEVFGRIEKIFRYYKGEIMSKLVHPEDYQDAEKTSFARIAYEDSQADLEILYKELNALILIKQDAAENVKEDMFKSFNFLQRFVQLLGITLVVGGILIALFTARSITKPVSKLRKMLLSMGLGILPTERFRPRNDEIGDMGNALNDLVQSMHQTTKFAEETGAGNFEAIHKPLSKDDNLGHSLIKMRDNLAENERGLEQKVKERTEEVVRQKEEIENKNGQLEILYKQVTDSILYAKRIQEAILPPDSIIKELVPNSFVLFKPKDIVSGDFYWFDKKDELVYFSTVDCTGHGVPGAFMSLVGT
ncbi:MAG: HAMP domain-containing protein [Sphingobacteriaceae bacterium]|nr:HAMP domain-containing protein [Sphingobacteriaceae bacterium]